MASICDDPLYLKVSGLTVKFCNRVNDNLHRQREQREANKKKSELQIQMASQLQIHEELRARLLQDVTRAADMRRLCAELEERLTIADTDRSRLDTAKEVYQIAKELTGIRWDFTTSQHIAKGYIKSIQKKLLEPFELEADNVEQSIWNRIVDVHCSRHSLWHLILQHAHKMEGQVDKENTPCN